MRCRLRAFFFLSFQNRSSGFQSGEDGREEKEPRMIAPAFQKSCARFRCMRRMPIDDEGDRAFGILEISFPGFDERLRSPTAVCQEAQLPPALTSEITFKPSLAPPVRLTAGHLRSSPVQRQTSRATGSSASLSCRFMPLRFCFRSARFGASRRSLSCTLAAPVRDRANIPGPRRLASIPLSIPACNDDTNHPPCHSNDVWERDNPKRYI